MLGKNSMTAQRKRFRIEELQFGAMPELNEAGSDQMHERFMTELRGIREQMGRITLGSRAKAEDTNTLAQVEANAKAALESYRAQIAQCEKLKVELDLNHEAINSPKQEIDLLHGKSF